MEEKHQTVGIPDGCCCNPVILSPSSMILLRTERMGERTETLNICIDHGGSMLKT